MSDVNFEVLLYPRRLGQELTGKEAAAGAGLEEERDKRAEMAKETILLVEVALKMSTKHNFDMSSVMNVKAPDTFAARCAMQLIARSDARLRFCHSLALRQSPVQRTCLEARETVNSLCV